MVTLKSSKRTESEPGWDWWEPRLDIGEWQSRAEGKREVMATCPVHGGGSLHVSRGTVGGGNSGPLPVVTTGLNAMTSTFCWM